MGRLVGVDLARALAVFGMYIVHIGPPLSATTGVGSWIRYLADGHSSVLFATLAGFSLMLLAGRREPKTGLAGRQAKARIAIRAVVLLALGTAMAMEYGGVIILGFYGVYFLLALPLVRLSAKTLAILAAAFALVTPQLAFVLTSLLTPSVQESINTYDPLRRLSEVGVLDLLLTGFYPALTWMSFVIAGMALGRLDLSSGTVRRRLAAVGAALTVAAYGMSLLLAGKNALRSTAEDGSSSGGSGSMPPGSGSMPPGGGSMPPRRRVVPRYAGVVAPVGRAAQRHHVRHHRQHRSRHPRDRGRDGADGPPAATAPPGEAGRRRRRHVPDRLRRPLPRTVRAVHARRDQRPAVMGAAAHVHPRGDRVRHDLVPLLPPRPPGVPAQRCHQAGEAHPMTPGRVGRLHAPPGLDRSRIQQAHRPCSASTRKPCSSPKGAPRTRQSLCVLIQPTTRTSYSTTPVALCSPCAAARSRADDHGVGRRSCVLVEVQEVAALELLSGDARGEDDVVGQKDGHGVQVTVLDGLAEGVHDRPICNKLHMCRGE
jgi:uncharacterized membrane protein